MLTRSEMLKATLKRTIFNVHIHLLKNFLYKLLFYYLLTEYQVVLRIPVLKLYEECELEPYGVEGCDQSYGSEAHKSKSTKGEKFTNFLQLKAR